MKEEKKDPFEKVAGIETSQIVRKGLQAKESLADAIPDKALNTLSSLNPNKTKVLFSNKEIGWQQGCPAYMEELCLTRNTETVEAFIQWKVRNISGSKIGSITFDAKVSYEEEEPTEITQRFLDADILPGRTKILTLKLEHPDAIAAESIITAANNGDAVSFEKDPAKIETEQLDLSEKAVSERRHLLGRAAGPYKVQEGAGWWICACGSPNVGSESCWNCKCQKESLVGLEDNDSLEEMMNARIEKEARQALEGNNPIALRQSQQAIAQLDDAETREDLEQQLSAKLGGMAKKTKKRAAVIGGIVIALVAVVAAAIIAMNFLSSSSPIYALTKVSYYSGSSSKSASETHYVLEDNGLIKRTWESSSGSSKSKDTYYTYDDNGMPVKTTYGTTDDKTFTCGLDLFGRITKIVEEDEGETTTASYEYDLLGKLSRMTESSDDYDVNITYEDGFPVKGSMASYSSLYDNAEFTCTIDSRNSAGKPEQVTYSITKNGKAIEKVYRFEYDGDGNITKQYEDGKLVYQYEWARIESPAKYATLIASSNFIFTM